MTIKAISAQFLWEAWRDIFSKWRTVAPCSPEERSTMPRELLWCLEATFTTFGGPVPLRYQVTWDATSFKSGSTILHQHECAADTALPREPYDGRSNGSSASVADEDTVWNLCQAPPCLTAEASRFEKQSHSRSAGMIFLLRNRHCYWTLMGVEKSQPRTPGKPERQITKWVLSHPPGHKFRHSQTHPSFRLNRSRRHKEIVCADGSRSWSESSSYMTLPSTYNWASWRIRLTICWCQPEIESWRVTPDSGVALKDG